MIVATRRKKFKDKKEEVLLGKDAFSVIIKLSRLGNDSIEEGYKLLSQYKKELGRKAINKEEFNTLKRIIRVMRMKSLVNGNTEMFKKLGKLDLEINKIKTK